MKKGLLFIILLVILTGCENFKSTTYTFKDVSSMSAKAAEKGYALLLEVQFCEYYGDDRVDVKTIKNCQNNELYSFKAHELAEKIKICVGITLCKDGKEIISRTNWFANVIYLEQGEITEIVLDDNTMLSTYMP
ncbi:MAG: hypothetical protein PHD07_02215 [Bacteroidales bacterium]|nr:hypothetical protein [Bacteroidales bacterium]